MKTKKSLSLFLIMSILLTCFMILGVQENTAQAAAVVNYDRFESYNYPGNYVRNLNGRAHMDPDANITPVTDGQWKLVPGLADPTCISFESVTQPGYFLRHQNSDIYLHQNNGTALFKQDATFRIVAGLKDINYISFQSYNYPTHYIRHYNGYWRIDPNSTSDLYKQDATFRKVTINNNANYKKVMPLGDSITEGFQYPEGGGYRVKLWDSIVKNDKLVDFVGSAFNGPRNLGDNNCEGHGGWRIYQVDAQINGWMNSAAPQRVLLHIGTNDMYNDANAANAPGALSALIDKICAKLPAGGKLYVAKIVPSTDSAVDARIINYNNQIPGIVQSKVDAGKPVYLVDMYSAISKATDFADTLHPNTSGYDKMAAVWYNAISADLLSSGTGTNLSKGKTVTVSSTSGDAGANAVDGNTMTRWTANGSAKPQWLKVDLGQNRNISRIQTQFEFGSRYYKYKIEYSDNDSTWYTYADRTTNTNTENLYIDTASAVARYVRITVTGTQNSGDWAAIWEFQVYGS